jgi:hypothetical protein
MFAFVVSYGSTGLSLEGKGENVLSGLYDPLTGMAFCKTSISSIASFKCLTNA